MALQIWIPCDGRNNLGLTGKIPFSNGVGVTYADGKIGQCLSYNGNGGNIGAINYTLGNAVTMTCWVYYTSRPASGKNDWCFQLGTSSGFVNTVLGIVTYPDNISIAIGGLYHQYSYTLSTGVWYHFAVTWNGSVATFYINGIKQAEFTDLNTGTKKVATAMALGSNVANSNTRLRGKLNDVRVYDYCLSPKEVHEISKGLIVHYKLDSVDVALSKCTNVTWNQQIVYGSFSSGTTGWSIESANVTSSNNTVTIEKTSSARGGFLYQTRTRNNHKYYFKGTMRLVEEPDEDSTKYMLLGFYNTTAIGNNPYVTIRTSEWTTVSTVGVPDQGNSSTLWFGFRVGYSASPVGLKGQAKYAMLIDLTQMFGKGNEPSKEECDKIFYKNVYNNDSAGTVKNLAIPIVDHSGNGWTPTVVNPTPANIGLESGSPRYDCYTRFGANTYLELVSPTAEARTASFWVKIPSLPTSSSNYQIMFVDYKSRLAFGIDRGSTGAIGLLTSCNLVNTDEFNLTDFTAGQWHHVVVVNNGTSATSTSRILYIDGVQQTNRSANGYWTHQVDCLQVGRRSYSVNNTENNLSDFRLYATALTQEDVLDLYHTSAVVNSDSSLHTFQVKEESTEPEITATGSTITREFVEITDNEYLYLPSNVCVPITDATYAAEDVLMAKTVIRYATGGSGRDLMGLNTSGHAYWGVTSGGAWEPHGTFTYTNSDITVKNSVSYTRTVNSGENWGHYTIGALYAYPQDSNPYRYSTRNKYIYHVSLYKNGDLIKDLYPMKEGSYCGLYDIVSGTFYPCNKTTGVLGSDADTPVLSVYKDKIETSNIIEY